MVWFRNQSDKGVVDVAAVRLLLDTRELGIVAWTQREIRVVIRSSFFFSFSFQGIGLNEKAFLFDDCLIYGRADL